MTHRLTRRLTHRLSIYDIMMPHRRWAIYHNMILHWQFPFRKIWGQIFRNHCVHLWSGYDNDYTVQNHSLTRDIRIRFKNKSFRNKHILDFFLLSAYNIVYEHTLFWPIRFNYFNIILKRAFFNFTAEKFYFQYHTIVSYMYRFNPKVLRKRPLALIYRYFSFSLVPLEKILPDIPCYPCRSCPHECRYVIGLKYFYSGIP